jgi:hypothetical protein
LQLGTANLVNRGPENDVLLLNLRASEQGVWGEGGRRGKGSPGCALHRFNKTPKEDVLLPNLRASEQARQGV